MPKTIIWVVLIIIAISSCRSCKTTEHRTHTVYKQEKVWTWKSYGEENYEFTAVFKEKNSTTMNLILKNASGATIGKAEISKPGPVKGQEWSGKWLSFVNGDWGYIGLKEIPGSNGFKFSGYQSAGRASDKLTNYTTLEFE